MRVQPTWASLLLAGVAVMMPKAVHAQDELLPREYSGGFALLSEDLERELGPSSFRRRHEEGAPFSGAIIDPLKVHHAHIEDEQRLNLFFADDARTADGRSPDAFMNSVELAVTWDEHFRWGSEVIIPFTTAGHSRDYTVGDIEFQPLKYAFVSQPETIWSVVLGFTLPTGSERQGVGDGNTVFEPHLFFDQAWDNWFLGVNLVPFWSLGPEHGSGFEYGLVLSYSFIEWERTKDQTFAPTKPNQAFVPSLSLEVLGEQVLRGPEQGESVFSLLPGLNLWNPASGWTVRFGVEVPLSEDRESDVVFMIQIGNHLDWKKLFGLR